MRSVHSIVLALVSLCAVIALGFAHTTIPARAGAPAANVFLPFVAAPGAPDTPPGPTPTPPTTADGALFLEPGEKIAYPTMLADAPGGLHAAYYYQVPAAEHPDAVYSYCPPPASTCLAAESWQHVRVYGPVDEVQLQLTPAGQPRMLLGYSTIGFGGHLMLNYVYAECDTGCLNTQNWHSTEVTATQLGYIADSRDLTRRSFALDHAGRPRFVFYDYGSGDYPEERHGGYYYQCDTQCANAANWHGSRFTRVNPENETISDLVVSPVLKFASANQPRILGQYHAFDAGFDSTFSIAYFACNAGCGADTAWDYAPITPSGSGPKPAWDLELDGADRPRVVVYHEEVSGDDALTNQLVYYQCDTGCVNAAGWQSLNFNPDVPKTVGQGADLALDSHGMPRISHLANNGGLAFSWCDSGCMSGANWKHVLAEPTSELDADGSVIIPASCVEGVWYTYGTSLALDPNDDIRIAYNATYQAQCPNLPPPPGEPPTGSFQEVAHAVRVFLSPKPQP